MSFKKKILLIKFSYLLTHLFDLFLLIKDNPLQNRSAVVPTLFMSQKNRPTVSALNLRIAAVFFEVFSEVVDFVKARSHRALQGTNKSLSQAALSVF